jgi:7-carboxy-7-deazaguanine synthase
MTDAELYTLSPRKIDLEKTLRISEIFLSVQGESTWAGMPCLFIRLARCNLRCRWCDTEYAFHGGESRTLEDILTTVKTQAGSWSIKNDKNKPRGVIEITGGEPLAQKHCIDLSEVLIQKGYTVLVETSGSLPINVLPREVHTIMDLKCPDSDECGKNYWPNIDALDPQRDEIKFVIAGRKDYEWSRGVVQEYNLNHRCRAILFSPVFGEVEARDMVSWILEDDLPVRFQLQMHKFIWPPSQRGV